MEPDQRFVRGILLAALVGGAVVVAFFGWMAVEEFQRLQGDDVLLVERGRDLAPALLLDVNRTFDEMPALAALLDAAWEGSRASTNDAQEVAAFMEYLDALAREEGADSIFGQPFDGNVRWEDRVLRLTRLH